VGYGNAPVHRMNLCAGELGQSRRISVSAHHDRHASGGALKMRQVHCWPRVTVKRGLFDIPDDADDLPRTLFKADGESTTDRLFARPISMRQSLVDNDNGRRI